MFHFLQKKFEFSDYQTAQLRYLFLTVVSELSKFLILAILFRNDIKTFVYGILFLCILRFSTGGFHCNTYIGCFFTTLAFLIVSLKVLPLIPVPIFLMYIILILCAYTNLTIGPVSSDKRLPQTDKTKKRLANQSFLIIVIHLFFQIFHQSPLITVGSWIIVIHTLQLMFAKLLQVKEVSYEKP